MNTTHEAGESADPVALLSALDPNTIRDRLAQIERDRRALLVLLRAACRLSPRVTTEREDAGRG